MTNVNILFTISAPALDDATAFHQFGQWVMLNERNGRLLFDAVCPIYSVEPVLQALTQMGKDPVIVGGWNRDGSPLAQYPLNVEEWIRVAPDVMDDTDPENLTPVRPIGFQEIHGWAGWQPKLRQTP